MSLENWGMSPQHAFCHVKFACNNQENVVTWIAFKASFAAAMFCDVERLMHHSCDSRGRWSQGFSGFHGSESDGSMRTERHLLLFLDAILHQGFLRALPPCLFAMLLPAPTFPSQCCSFSPAFQDVVWNAGDQLADELHGHGNFRRRKDIALCHRDEAFVSLQLKSHNAFSLYLCTQEGYVATSSWNSTAAKIPLP